MTVGRVVAVGRIVAVCRIVAGVVVPGPQERVAVVAKSKVFGLKKVIITISENIIDRILYLP